MRDSRNERFPPWYVFGTEISPRGKKKINNKLWRWDVDSSQYIIRKPILSKTDAATQKKKKKGTPSNCVYHHHLYSSNNPNNRIRQGTIKFVNAICKQLALPVGLRWIRGWFKPLIVVIPRTGSIQRTDRHSTGCEDASSVVQVEDECGNGTVVRCCYDFAYGSKLMISSEIDGRTPSKSREIRGPFRQNYLPLNQTLDVKIASLFLHGSAALRPRQLGLEPPTLKTA